MEIQKIHRHTFDTQHFFYEHQDCAEKHPIDDPFALEDDVALADVPEDAECCYCLLPVHGKSMYEQGLEKETSMKTIVYLVQIPESMDTDTFRTALKAMLLHHWLVTQGRAEEALKCEQGLLSYEDFYEEAQQSGLDAVPVELEEEHS